MTTYRPRWRTDASGFVANYAGKWAGREWDDRDALVAVIAAMVNGQHVEIVEVES